MKAAERIDYVIRSGVVTMLTALAGCFTVTETPYPEVSVASLPEKRDLAVQLAGFEATVVSYIPVYGRETVLVTGGYHRRHHPHYRTATVLSETYVPQVNNTSVFLDRATDALERGGFTLRSTAPEYQVEVKFSGPVVETSESLTGAAWMLFSIFTADYGVQTWSAHLRIRHIASGRLVHSREFAHRYESLVWGPLPIFSPLGSDKSDYNFMQSRCLSVLTDLAVADASTFLSAKAHAAPIAVGTVSPSEQPASDKAGRVD